MQINIKIYQDLMGRESTQGTADTKEGSGWVQISDNGTKFGRVVHKVKKGCQCDVLKRRPTNMNHHNIQLYGRR